jgi:hypothetical protein
VQLIRPESFGKIERQIGHDGNQPFGRDEKELGIQQALRIPVNSFLKSEIRFEQALKF